MEKRANLVIVDAGERTAPAGREGPRIGLGPEVPLGAPHQEKERVAREAGRAEVLLAEATPVQLRLLQRLTRAAPGRKLRFPSIATLEDFLNATAEEPDADALPDEEVQELWDEIAASTSEPQDYEMEIDQEIDYGGGRAQAGVRDGVPFEEPIEEKRRAPKTYEDCIVIAQQRGAGYGINAGWHFCLEENLPEVPDNVEIDGREYVDCIGFGLSKKTGEPIFGFAEGARIIELPVAKVLGTKLPAAAQLWLDSYETWRGTQQTTKKTKPTAKKKS